MIAILPGAETGVDLSDKLAARLGTRNNGEEYTEARRNKYMMGEQASCRCWLLIKLSIYCCTIPQSTKGRNAPVAWGGVDSSGRRTRSPFTPNHHLDLFQSP